MNNNIVFSTEDGIKIKVDFNNKIYEYSTSTLSIDTSDLINALAESEIIEELEIDEQSIIEFQLENEISDEFVELWRFITNIPKAYNKSINQMLELE